MEPNPNPYAAPQEFDVRAGPSFISTEDKDGSIRFHAKFTKRDLRRIYGKFNQLLFWINLSLVSLTVGATYYYFASPSTQMEIPFPIVVGFLALILIAIQVAEIVGQVGVEQWNVWPKLHSRFSGTWRAGSCEIQFKDRATFLLTDHVSIRKLQNAISYQSVQYRTGLPICLPESVFRPEDWERIVAECEGLKVRKPRSDSWPTKILVPNGLPDNAIEMKQIPRAWQRLFEAAESFGTLWMFILSGVLVLGSVGWLLKSYNDYLVVEQRILNWYGGFWEFLADKGLVGWFYLALVTAIISGIVFFMSGFLCWLVRSRSPYLGKAGLASVCWIGEESYWASSKVTWEKVDFNRDLRCSMTRAGIRLQLNLANTVFFPRRAFASEKEYLEAATRIAALTKWKWTAGQVKPRGLEQSN